MHIYINDLNLKFSKEETQVLADSNNHFGKGGVWLEAQQNYVGLLGVNYAKNNLRKLIAAAKRVKRTNKYKAVAMNDAKIAQGIIDKLTEANTEFKKEVKRVTKEMNEKTK